MSSPDDLPATERFFGDTDVEAMQHWFARRTVRDAVALLRDLPSYIAAYDDLAPGRLEGALVDLDGAIAAFAQIRARVNARCLQEAV